MSDSPSSGYKVGHLATVKDQILALTDRAAEVGLLDIFSATVEELMDLLQTMPLDVGDPTWNTMHEGGHVCRAIVAPLVVHYVVYEVERKVCILDLKALPGSPLT